MKLPILTAIFTLTTFPSLAQISEQDLTNAYQVCRQHWINRQYTPTPDLSRPPGGWEKGWEHCAGIQDAYQKSAAAKIEREIAEKHEEERKKTEELAKKIK